MNLQKLLETVSLDPTYLQSRVHKLHGFSFPACNFYIKREDELSCGLSGTKKRKYASLIPYLIREKFEEVCVIGGAYSNNVMSACQVLKENDINFRLFLLGSSDLASKGNLLLTRLLTSPNQIEWIQRSEWDKVHERVKTHINYDPAKRKFILEEGAAVKEALPGALTLAIDICRNEAEHQIEFDHIFIDSGTGFSASALILGLQAMGKTCHVHVVQVAEAAERFHQFFSKWKLAFETDFLRSKPLPSFSTKDYSVYSPSIAPSFGSINRKLLEYIQLFAQREGILLDPIYSAKLFYEASLIIQKQGITGNILIIHSGGIFSLLGYQERIQKFLISNS